MDYKHEAMLIICEHTNAYLQAVKVEYTTNHDMMNDMYTECAFILTSYLLEGKYTPMQYAAIRNELGSMIWNIFDKFVEKEDS